jgi:hypothetical protein
VEGIPTCGAEDIELAVQHTEVAFEEYSKFPAMQHTECFHRLSAPVDEQLIDMLTLD